MMSPIKQVSYLSLTTLLMSKTLVVPLKKISANELFTLIKNMTML